MAVTNYPFPIVGGLERQCHELCKALRSEYGIDVRVLSPSTAVTTVTDELVEGITVNRLAWPRSRARRLVQCPLDLALALWRLRASFDVVHVHQQSAFGLSVTLIARILGKPVLTKLGSVAALGVPGLQKGVFGWLRVCILKLSHGFAVLSDESASELRQIGIADTRLLKVTNGISQSGFLEAEGSNQGHTHRQVRVIYCGRMSREKRVDVLLHAWKRVASQFGCLVRLELWGDGPLRLSLQREASTWECSQSIAWIGHRSDTTEGLKHADIFVLPSEVEGNSNAVLEAMRSGLPIVATGVGGTPMQVGPDGLPFLVPVGDPESLAERLSFLIRRPDLRGIVGRAMQQRAHTCFCINSVARCYCCAYQQLTDGRQLHLNNCGEWPDQHLRSNSRRVRLADGGTACSRRR